jgi:hypothetical protein
MYRVNIRLAAPADAMQDSCTNGTLPVLLPRYHAHAYSPALTEVPCSRSWCLAGHHKVPGLACDVARLPLTVILVIRGRDITQTARTA